MIEQPTEDEDLLTKDVTDRQIQALVDKAKTGMVVIVKTNKGRVLKIMAYSYHRDAQLAFSYRVLIGKDIKDCQDRLADTPQELKQIIIEESAEGDNLFGSW